MSAGWRAAIDIGGTFTDLLLEDRGSGRYAIGKVLTDHASPARAVRDALRALLESNGVPAAELEHVIHATTLVTNAVIERKGAKTALLMTDGFRDTMLIGREHRYDMYDVLLEKPEPLVPRHLTFGVPERVLADGTIFRRLDERGVRRIADELRELGVEAVAVCLLHGYRFPDHERRVRELLRERMPGVQIALSHEVVGEQREYERAVATSVNAYVLQIVDRYLAELEGDLAALGHTGQFLVMLSSGATATAQTARAFPVRLIESGPAAGALAAAHASREIGLSHLLSFDMGGTTAKACLIEDGRPAIASEFEVARLHRFKRGSGLPLKTSSVELIEIGAGGGSVARVDRFGLLQVGPDSAGSDPGPACYGGGGTEPTVTDADLLLGFLDPAFFLGGRMALRVDLARAAMARVAEPLGLTPERAAWVVHEVVNENMSNAARVHAAEHGRTIEDYPLFAFGGAGPVHAYRVAQNLGIRMVIAPLGAGVGSTIGLLAAPLAFDFVRTAVDRVSSLDWKTATALLIEMEEAGRALLAAAGVAAAAVQVERSADMRLIGQSHEITVALPGERPGAGDGPRIERAFFATYARLFDRPPPNVAVELVSWRVRLSGRDPDLRLARETGAGAVPRTGAGTDGALRGTRTAYFPEGGFQATPVYDRYRLAAGAELVGPAIVEERESTLVIGTSARFVVDDHRNVVVTLPE